MPVATPPPSAVTTGSAGMLTPAKALSFKSNPLNRLTAMAMPHGRNCGVSINLGAK